jgi:hypothetical protein
MCMLQSYLHGVSATIRCCRRRSASLTVSVQREGLVTQGGPRPLGLVFPALAVGRCGQLLLVSTYAGPGNAAASAAAYPGKLVVYV